MTKLKNMKFFSLLLLCSILVLSMSCKDDEVIIESGDLVDIAFDPTPYPIVQPTGFPLMDIPVDNPMTQEGFELGRRLFYDVRLSKDNSMSCASCHLPEMGFADGTAFSTGVDGEQTRRSSMSLVNIGYFADKLFWDGRAPSLEAQALLPVTDAIELINTWTAVEEMMKEDAEYPTMFRKAFGIEDSSEIDSLFAAKAIAQFERTLVSSNSKYDKFVIERDFSYEFTDSEARGEEMYFDFGSLDGGSGVPDAQCFHCHGGVLFTTGEFFNNGLDDYPTLADYPDKGLGEVTGMQADFAKFKAPTLRNIELTAPYMHDGRFTTLEEVIEHYSTGVHFATNLDVNLDAPLNLSESEKEDLVNFLKTLTDTEFIENPAFQNPF
jgi:cytochrome c peroxidase